MWVQKRSPAQIQNNSAGTTIGAERILTQVKPCVCFVVGTRPNFIKAAPVLRALEGGVDTPLIHTGQHYDPEMSDVFLDELDLPVPDVFLGVGSGTHAEQTARALVGVERVLAERRPDIVVVSGDVNSTLAAALAAVKVGIPVAHIEAGLRSFDWTMPEEHNRRLTDHLSTILFAHSESAVENLAAEGVLGRVHLVGNTMIDSLMTHVDAARARAPWGSYGLAPGEYALVTLHRPALVDDDLLLAETLEQLDALADEMPVLFPVHPRTRARIDALDLCSRSPKLVLSDPLGYLEFLGLEAAARLVLTDSGGVQEETTALGVRCFTLRDNTERPVTVELGTNTLLGADPERISEIPRLVRGLRETAPVPLWDGRAGERTATIVMALVGLQQAV
jgi:UDP-N-acetylglucosamine 2-epimerase (non-hydrolysing)